MKSYIASLSLLEEPFKTALPSSINAIFSLRVKSLGHLTGKLLEAFAAMGHSANFCSNHTVTVDVNVKHII